MTAWEIRQGDVIERLREMPAESVHCIVTSPPYWSLRDYGVEPTVWGGDPEHVHEWNLARRMVERGAGNWTQAANGDQLRTGRPQTRFHGDVVAARENTERVEVADGFCPCGAWLGALGLEPTPDLFVEHMVTVFRELRRVLRRDGTLWLNLGDSYAGGGRGGNPAESAFRKQATNVGSLIAPSAIPVGLKPKDLLGMPWRLAFALQADGWWLRSAIVWAKPGPMPESVEDRPTRSYEMMFMLSKRPRYFWDGAAIKEVSVSESGSGNGYKRPEQLSRGGRGSDEPWQPTASRNARDVWTIASEPMDLQLCRACKAVYRGVEYRRLRSVDEQRICRCGASSWLSHFATFPTELPRRCILAGTSEHGVCGECGAPWARVMERRAFGKVYSATAYDDTMQGGPLSRSRQAYRAAGLEGPPPTRTLGWRPTCPHTDAPVVPAAVLDPFAGAGTTIMVAARLGRRGIGVELNPEYIAMAERRILADHGAAAPTNGHTPPEGVQGRMLP